MAELTAQKAYRLAVDAHKSNRKIEALNIYNKLLSVLPSNADIHHNVALLYIEFCNFKQGEHHLKIAINLQPDIERYILSWINFHSQMGKFEQAQKICLNAVKKFKHSDKFRELQTKITYLSNQHYSLLDLAMNQVLSFYQCDLLQEAQLACENLAYVFDKNPKVNNLLGAIYTRLHQYDEAIKSFNTAIEYDPRFSEAYYNLGNVFNEIQDFNAAINYYEKAIILDEGNVKAYNNLGSSLLSLGKVKEAIASFKRALSIYSSYAEAYYNLGNAYSVENEYDLAIKSFRSALAINPNHVKAYVNLAISYKSIGNVKKAEASLVKAMEIDQTNVVALNILGVLYSNTQRNELAINIFERILSIDPNNVSAMFNLAVSYKDISKLKTLDLLEKILILQPDYSPALHIFNSLSGTKSKRAPIEYVEQLFDSYADEFEIVLLEKLNYCAPDKIKSIIKGEITDTHHFKTLDIGCGTGLVAKQLRPLVSEITGIDLSKNMLEKAKKSGLYKDLYHCGIHDFVKNYPLNYDLIVAADVFIYVGDLDELFCDLRRMTPIKTYFIFCTEKYDGSDFCLNRSGRFAHSEQYVRGICGKHNIKIINHFQDKVRMEYGSWVDGDYFLIKF